jgi:hypothetical protein
MNTIKVTAEDVQNDYQSVYDDFISDLRDSNSLSRNIDEEKINWFYSWGSFVKKTKTHEDRVLRDLKNQESLEMEFEDRLEFEISKIRVTITMEAGKYTRGDRVRKRFDVSEKVIQMVGEQTKLRMLLEQKELDNQDIIDTVPAINTDIFPLEQLQAVLGEDHPHAQDENSEGVSVERGQNNQFEEEELNVDSILEKVFSDGVESLTEREKEFLDNQG